MLRVLGGDMEKTAVIELVERYKSDPESVYNTWFIGSAQRMKAFRAIRRGVRDTVEAIAAGKFGTDFKGSPLAASDACAAVKYRHCQRLQRALWRQEEVRVLGGISRDARGDR